MTNQPESMATIVNVPLRAVVDNAELAVEVVAETLRPGALDLPVRWAHVSELRDPAPYLLGDELLLTAGVNLPDGQREVDRYVGGLRAAGITALGFGVTPPLHEELPESLRRACARHGLPLLVVPVGTPFLAISRAVSVALDEASHREQRRVTEAREALTRAASGGLDELATRLAERLSGWMCLVGADDRPVAWHGAPRVWPEQVRELLARLRAGTGIRSATTELADGTFVVAQPVYPQATASHLLVVGRRRRFDGTDRAIIAVGAALLGLVGGDGAETGALGAAVTGLLIGRPVPGEIVARLLGPGEYRLLAGVPFRRGPAAAESGYDWLRARLDTPLVAMAPGPRFTAIARGTPELDALRSSGWLVVAGSPAPAERLGETVSEVDALLTRAAALERPVAAGAGLSTVVDPAVAAEFAARTLAPLRALGRGEPLVETLRTWLANHGGWDRTAAALGVHRNSVRHRIGQVERVLGVDLADPETRMELWFALRWS
ncbi:PucR family transcriptional regulator [Amycolatopsis anabasis]|uniref:PucR family transcriptional regulator n=1 Tax=Amycolatopsis anabasis TaxID=1840409 RepID=UPI0015D28079|nr:PucR family transcriptional regulator [Amycolatopsis anabasis]